MHTQKQTDTLKQRERHNTFALFLIVRHTYCSMVLIGARAVLSLALFFGFLFCCFNRAVMLQCQASTSIFFSAVLIGIFGQWALLSWAQQGRKPGETESEYASLEFERGQLESWKNLRFYRKSNGSQYQLFKQKLITFCLLCLF